MQACRPLTDHLDELVFSSYLLQESHLLARLSDRLDDGFFLFLELQWDQACFAFIKTLNEDRTSVQETDIDLRFVLILLVNEGLFQVLEFLQDDFLGLQLVLTPYRV